MGSSRLQRTAEKSRVAVIWPKNMLHDARMAGLAKLRRSIRSTDERQLRAVYVGRGEIVWQDRCDAANGSKEPKLSIFCLTANVRFRETDQIAAEMTARCGPSK